MAEYIDKAEAIAAIDEFIENIPNKGKVNSIILSDDLVIAKQIISDQPAADVVEVVRCKDCYYWAKATVNKRGFLICPASYMEITEDYYCSYGERRKEDKH